jgi:hypothetical protein
LSIEHILFVVSQEAKAARGNRSNQSVGEVTMNIALRKNDVKGSSVLKKIKVESKVDEGRDVIVRRATVKWEGFQSFMVLWTKLYGRV